MSDLRITPGLLSDPQIVAMLTFHFKSSHEIMLDGFAFALDLSSLLVPEISVYAAWDGDRLVGVGALRELDPRHGEVKSMHSDREYRGRGVGGALPEYMIGVARDRGYSRVSLETGSQGYYGPARSLYARRGFAACGPFGSYRESLHNHFMCIELDPSVYSTQSSPISR